MDMLSTVIWHDIQFKMVKSTSIEQLVVQEPYLEHLIDYPYAVPEWEDIKQAGSDESKHRLVSKSVASRFTISDAQQQKPSSPKSGIGKALPLPKGDLPFSPGTAFVYVMEK
jgi:hypothetical protein